MSKENELSSNKIDVLTSAAKSVVGIVPFAGPLLSELVGQLIPNQRIDRLTKYASELENRLNNIPSSVIDGLKDNPEFIDLIEEGFVQASRAISEDRRQYIASIVSKGISDEEMGLAESKYFLKLLQELNDVEIIWLRYYLVPGLGTDEDFRDKHANVLNVPPLYIGADENTERNYTLQRSYREHLERLELIEHKIRFDRSKMMPEYDRVTGKPEIAYTTITILGKMLLRQIGLTHT